MACSVDLLRGHVGGGAEDRAGAGRVFQGVILCQGLGQSEVGHLGDQLAADVGQQDVGGLKVAVHQAMSVGRGDAFEDAAGQSVHLTQGEPAASKQLVQGRSLDVLHDQPRRAADVHEIGHGDDVGVVEGALDAALLDQALADVSPAEVEDLEGVQAAQLTMAYPVDIGHAALPEQSLDDVAVDDHAGT